MEMVVLWMTGSAALIGVIAGFVRANDGARSRDKRIFVGMTALFVLWLIPYGIGISGFLGKSSSLGGLIGGVVLIVLFFVLGFALLGWFPFLLSFTIAERLREAMGRGKKV